MICVVSHLMFLEIMGAIHVALYMLGCIHWITNGLIRVTNVDRFSLLSGNSDLREGLRHE